LRTVARRQFCHGWQAVEKVAGDRKRDVILSFRFWPQAITLGADKAYDAEDFVNELRSMKVTPHVAQNSSGRSSAIEGRMTTMKNLICGSTRLDRTAIVSAAVAAIAAGTPAHAYEGGSPGWAQKPGITLGEPVHPGGGGIPSVFSPLRFRQAF
jgi:hypothetical protein